MPLKESLVGVYKLLKGAIELDARFQNPLGPKKEIKSGTWKYQVLYHDNLGAFQNIDQPSAWLQTDEDYRRMVQRICNANKQAFHAVLMQVSLCLHDNPKPGCSLTYLDLRNLSHKSKRTAMPAVAKSWMKASQAGTESQIRTRLKQSWKVTATMRNP